MIEKNAKDDYGNMPLYLDAAKGHTNIAEALIAACANLHAKSKLDSASLHQAASRGCADIGEALIAAGADLKDC